MEANSYFSKYPVNVKGISSIFFWMKNAEYADRLYYALQLMGLLETLIIKEVMTHEC